MADLFSEVRTTQAVFNLRLLGQWRRDGNAAGALGHDALEHSRHLPKAKRMELMLRLNIALYDAGIAAWASKYHYSYWRPQTVIAATDAEYAGWEPMMQPPFHPEYVSGHSAFSGAFSTPLN